MLENFTYPGDIFPSDRFYSEDLSHPEITLCRDDEGCPAVEALTELPEPDEQHLQKVLQSRATLP